MATEDEMMLISELEDIKRERTRRQIMQQEIDEQMLLTGDAAKELADMLEQARKERATLFAEQDKAKHERQLLEKRLIEQQKWLDEELSPGRELGKPITELLIFQCIAVISTVPFWGYRCHSGPCILHAFAIF